VQALHTAAETITDQFNYTIQDTGGLQDTATLTVTIHGADDLPQAVADTGTMTEDSSATSFNVIANDTQDPDHTASNAITVGPGSITVTGPAGETFANTDAQAAIVSNEIQVTLTNADFQQLALGEHATVTVPYTLTGDVGETSSANLVVTVNGVNNVPVAVNDSGTMTEDQVGTFSVLANDTLDADHGSPNNVTAGTVGNLVAPAGEGITTADIGVSVNGSNQVVVTLDANFQHMQDGQTATFDIPYTLHGDQLGDTSSATLHVTVNGVNDAPTANAVTFTGVDSANYNTDLVVTDPGDASPTTTGPFKAITASLLSLSNASDVDGPNPLTFVPGTFTTTDGGKVVLQADGGFVFTPKVGDTNTSDSFSFTVTDGNTGVSGPGTVTATATIALQGPHIWYVNADAATDGDGSSEHPFNTLSHFAGAGGVDHSGDTIFLESSTAHYTGGLTLENNEQLISQSNGLVVADGGGGGGTVTLVAASGANAVVDGGVVLGTGDTIEGVNFGTTSGFALSGSSVGTVHVDDVTSGVINNASGGGVSIGGSSNVLNMNFSSVTTGGGTNGIALTGSSGTFHAHGGTISGASGAEVALSGGSVNFTEDGSVGNTSGSNVSISSMTGGTQSFTGAISGHGIALSSNTGATMSFSGGVAIDTSASNTTGFSATGGGTLTVTGSGNTINSGQGTALDVEHTTIGASNLTFQSISSSGGSATGIILDTTGASGGLHVTGVGTTASSGGTIASKTGSDGATASGNGIYLNSTSGLQLADMHLHDFQNYGISGTNVSGLSIDHTVVDGSNGTSVGGIGEGDVYFTGLSGSASVTNSTFTGAVYDAFHVFNDSGQTLNRIVMTGDTFATQGGVGNSSNSAIDFEATGGTFNATIQSSTLNGARSDLFHLNLLGTVSSDLVFGGGTTGLGNTLTNSNQNIVSGEAGIDVGGGGPTNNITLTYNISHNSISGVHGTDISVFKGTGTNASFTGTIDSNTIGTEGTAGSGSTQGAGIAVFQDGAGSSSTTITNNHISGVAAGAGAIDLLNHNGGGGDMTAVIQGNTIDTLDQANAFSGIYLQTGSSGSTDNNISDYTIGGAGSLANKIDIGSNSASAIVAGIILDEEGNTKVGLLGSPNYSGGPFDTNAVASYVAGSNTVTSNGSVTLGGGATPVFALTNPGLGYFGGAQFLLAAPGGVQASSPTPGETNLTQAELDSVVAAAIADWAAAGASASQLAALHATTFSVANLGGNILSEETTPAHITVDASAAGHGWYIDPTPSDNSEFANAQNAAGTDLLTDPSNAAAGHMDLLTAVTHELGHVLGRPDSSAAADVNDLMYINLVDGERKLPGTVDVAQANADTATYPSLAQASEGALPVSAQAPAGTPIVVGTAGNDIIDAGHGGNILFGGAGADHFVFGPSIQLNAPTAAAAQPITHVADYSAAQGDTFDFSALTSAFHASNVADASLVRAVEDPSGTFAMLQLNTNGDAPAAVSRGATQPSAVANWVDVAQIDGAHAGDAVNVLVDSHAAIHLAQIHATFLV
jgi:hypothetical protein